MKLITIQSDENTIAFLKEKGLIEINNPLCVHCGVHQPNFILAKNGGKIE